MNFQMIKLDLEKTEEPEIKLLLSTGSQEKQENSRKTSTFASFTTIKPLTVWTTANCGKILQEMGIPDYLLRKLYACQKQYLELDMEQQTGNKSGKEYIKATYFTLLI